MFIINILVIKTAITTEVIVNKITGMIEVK